MCEIDVLICRALSFQQRREENWSCREWMCFCVSVGPTSVRKRWCVSYARGLKRGRENSGVLFSLSLLCQETQSSKFSSHIHISVFFSDRLALETSTYHSVTARILNPLLQGLELSLLFSSCFCPHCQVIYFWKWISCVGSLSKVFLVQSLLWTASSFSGISFIHLCITHVQHWFSLSCSFCTVGCLQRTFLCEWWQSEMATCLCFNSIFIVFGGKVPSTGLQNSSCHRMVYTVCVLLGPGVVGCWLRIWTSSCDNGKLSGYCLNFWCFFYFLFFLIFCLQAYPNLHVYTSVLLQAHWISGWGANMVHTASEPSVWQILVDKPSLHQQLLSDLVYGRRGTFILNKLLNYSLWLTTISTESECL